MHHAKTAVVVFLHEILQNIPTSITEVRIWTDGPASQFKNRFVMEAMRMLSDSATSHGKGPVDGIEGCLKRSATEKVKTRQCVINDAKDFVHAVEGSKVAVTFISAQNVTERERSLNLTEIFENAEPIRGIAEYHWVGINDNSNLISSRISISERRIRSYC